VEVLGEAELPLFDPFLEGVLDLLVLRERAPIWWCPSMASTSAMFSSKDLSLAS
jgi:hypothetical protein